MGLMSLLLSWTDCGLNVCLTSLVTELFPVLEPVGSVGAIFRCQAYDLLCSN